jgi:hypothetical protein
MPPDQRDPPLRTPPEIPLRTPSEIGEDPPHSTVLQGAGSGVFEIKDDLDNNTYRLVYAVQIGKKLYVLHAFQKKSKQGITTPKKDVDLMSYCQIWCLSRCLRGDRVPRVLFHAINKPESL